MKHLRGFAIVTAMFILVVLAALGAFIVNISTNQQIGSVLDVQGVRAYQAARAGLEWGLYQVESTGAPPLAAASAAYNFSYGNPATSVGAASQNLRACPASPSSFAPLANTLSGFVVTVTCVATADGANNGPTVYVLIATACNQPVPGWTAATTACPNTTSPNSLYVERQLTVAL